MRTDRLDKRELQEEVFRLRALRDTCRRDAERATTLRAELLKARAAVRAAERRANHERNLRLEAERNATRFHALLLQARVRLVAHQKKDAA